MTEIVLTLAFISAFLIAVLAFLPAQQPNPQPVRVRRNDARYTNRR